MTLDTQIALALTAPDTFDKVHKNIMNIVNDFTIGFSEWVDELVFEDFDTYSNNSMKQLLEIYKKEKGL